MDAYDSKADQGKASGIFNFVDIHENEFPRNPNANGIDGVKQWRAGYENLASPAKQFDDSNKPNASVAQTDSPASFHLRPSPFVLDKSPYDDASTRVPISQMPQDGTVKPFCPQPPKPQVTNSGELVEKYKFIGFELATTGAIAGGALEANEWAKNHELATMNPEKREAMKSWSESQLGRSLEPMRRELAEAKAANETIGRQLAENANHLRESKTAFDGFRDSVQKEYIIRRQDKYFYEPLTAKDLNPGANIGTEEQVLSGEKLFIKGSKLAHGVEAMENARSIVKDSKSKEHYNSLREDAKVLWKEDRGKIGLKQYYPHEADLVLNQKRVDFFKKLDSDPSQFASKIGNAAELKDGTKLYLTGSPEANIISKHFGLLQTKAELELAAGAAQARVTNVSALLSGTLERGAGSWVGRTLCGSGRGLLYAAGMMAFGYAFEHAGGMFKPKEK